MAHDFIPRRDAEFRNWSRVFNEQINADPTQFGLTVAQAAQYADLHEAFANAYHRSHAAETRTPSAVIAKDETRQRVEREARQLARIIQATPTVTNEQRSDLALTVRATEGSVVPPPKEPPLIYVKLRFGSTVRILLRGIDSIYRGKPAGIAGAMVYSFVGETPPDSLSEWRFQGATTRTTMDITFGDGILPGAKVWITASWYNPRAQRGPAAQPRYTYIQCPTIMLGNESLRLAA